MTRIIFCEFLQAEAEGLDFKFYPGELGERIFQNISKQAWKGWLTKQTMLINEKKLNMMNNEHRQILEKEMINYLFNKQDVHIEGYQPLDEER